MRYEDIMTVSKDHPRACGANDPNAEYLGADNGSSPRVRGKRLVCRVCLPCRRIIPARAGQTRAICLIRLSAMDHPRACGANAAIRRSRMIPSGSSPRVRGKPVAIVGRCRSIRIIPARAGQTPKTLNSAPSSTDHPRACGANRFRLFCVRSFYGSSPRVRGKPVQESYVSVKNRIIPARAGQTAARLERKPPASDHPRACGANYCSAPRKSNQHGSSPRVRGKLAWMCLRRLLGRIIPARAGQTVRFYAKTLERWTLNNWIRTVAPIFVLLFLLPVIGQNAYIERHYSNQSFSWFSKLHYASAFDLSLVA